MALAVSSSASVSVVFPLPPWPKSPTLWIFSGPYDRMEASLTVRGVRIENWRLRKICQEGFSIFHSTFSIRSAKQGLSEYYKHFRSAVNRGQEKVSSKPEAADSQCLLPTASGLLG